MGQTITEGKGLCISSNGQEVPLRRRCSRPCLHDGNGLAVGQSEARACQAEGTAGIGAPDQG